MLKTLLVATTFLVCACSSSDSNKTSDNSNWNMSAGPVTTIPLGEVRTGEATYYTFANGDGACMFGPSPDDLNVAALNAQDWSTAAYCGACADVTGPSGKVRVRLVDQCPECPSGNLDLSPQAFQQIAAMDLGRVPITWNLVACDVIGPVKYRFKDGSSQWWTAVQVLNHRLPITHFEWSADGTQFKSIARSDYNYFLDESGFGPTGVTVRITAGDQVLVDSLPPVQELLVVDGRAQFQ
jgi:expansin (peptidoglycan-binding protein)